MSGWCRNSFAKHQTMEKRTVHRAPWQFSIQNMFNFLSIKLYFKPNKMKNNWVFTEYFLNTHRNVLIMCWFSFIIEEYLSRQEKKSRRKNMTIFLSTIGFSAIAVTLACIHIALCFVDVDVCRRKPGDLDL